ncbi:MAG: gliding motility-associated C-terminal domain-containing protein, partial [Saprospiraceae bacterium]|nr:gliding motility-associated C-terminal domain-containing protein [Saprospiraceae bacterium]
RTWTLTDDCGNSTSGDQTIVVLDTVTPTFTTPSDITLYLDSNCLVDTTTSSTGTLTNIQENCSNVSITYNDNIINNCGLTYLVERIWNISDECGNADAHIQLIEVLDTIAPGFDNPSSIIVFVDSMDIVDTTMTAIGVVANLDDNCSVVTAVYNDSVATINSNGILDEIYRRWTFTDECGNVSSTTQEITVTDTIAPPAVTPPVSYVDCDQVPVPDTSLIFPDLSAIVDITMTETRIDTPCIDRHTIVRRWTATSISGNQSVIDQVISIDVCPNTVNATISDNEVCQGEQVDFSVGFVTPSTESYYLQWYFSPDTLLGWAPIPGGSNENFTFAAYTFRNGFYKAVYSADASHSDIDACGWHSDILQLIVREHSQVINLSVDICDGDSYAVGDSIFTKEGNYTIPFQNIYGCDSIVSLRLGVFQIPVVNIDTIICEGDYYETSGGTRYYADGFFQDTLTSQVNCDSILNVSMSIIPRKHTYQTEYICEGDTYILGSQSLMTSGVYTDTLSAITGCDSIIHLELIVMPPTETTNNIEICAGADYEINGNTYFTTGIYYDTLYSQYGCDSVIITNLNVVNTIIAEIFDTICFGESYAFNGSDYTTTGSYQYQTLASTGCDSVTTLFLNVREDFTSQLDIQICEGETYNLNNKTFDSTGSFQETFSTSNGCDSTVTLNLLVVEQKTSTQAISMCPGDSVLIDGSYEYTAGTYVRQLFTSSGCDSIVTYVVSVPVSEPVSKEMTICEGDSILLNGIYQKDSGTFSETLQSQVTGCDSLVITDLFVEQSVDLIGDDITVCEGEFFTLVVDGASEVLWSNDQFLDCETCPNPSGRVEETTTFTATAESCFGTTSTINITVNVLERPTISVMPDTFVSLGSSLVLTAETSDPFSEVVWYDQDLSILCTNCTAAEVTPSSSGFYYVETTPSNGCVYRDSVLVNIKNGCDQAIINIPNFLTPNFDGLNEAIEVRYEGIQGLGSMKIFNRWGSLVFETDDPNNTRWDGTLNGAPANPGVYVYFIEYYCLNGDRVFKKGNITVIN